MKLCMYMLDIHVLHPRSFGYLYPMKTCMYMLDIHVYPRPENFLDYHWYSDQRQHILMVFPVYAHDCAACAFASWPYLFPLFQYFLCLTCFQYFLCLTCFRALWCFCGVLWCVVWCFMVFLWCFYKKAFLWCTKKRRVFAGVFVVFFALIHYIRWCFCGVCLLLFTTSTLPSTHVPEFPPIHVASLPAIHVACWIKTVNVVHLHDAMQHVFRIIGSTSSPVPCFNFHILRANVTKCHIFAQT